MVQYKDNKIRSIQSSVSAPAKFWDELDMIISDWDLGTKRSEVIQILLKYIIKHKEDKKFIEELKSL